MNNFDKPLTTDEGKKWLKDLLLLGPVHITFTKKDGTERKMTCTLKENLVKSYDKKTDRIKKSADDICPVFDIDLQEWRSFRYDTVKKIGFNL